MTGGPGSPPRAGLVRRAVQAVGAGVLDPVEDLGRAVTIGLRGFLNAAVPPLRVRETIAQLEFVGLQSLPIILLSAVFTGAVFTWDSYEPFKLFGAQGWVGGTVGIAISRELAPTLTALLVAGRAGSAMAAELGSMRVTEQIDAVEAMAVDPINYLVKPRLLATLAAVPMLTAVFDLVGIGGSYVLAVHVLGLSKPEFLVRLEEWVDWEDIWVGLVKSLLFGAIVGVVACSKGFYADGGATGVGRATTSAVVVASVTILVANFFVALVLPGPL